jgi:hypothetical protein
MGDIAQDRTLFWQKVYGPAKQCTVLWLQANDDDASDPFAAGQSIHNMPDHWPALYVDQHFMGDAIRGGKRVWPPRIMAGQDHHVELSLHA